MKLTSNCFSMVIRCYIRYHCRLSAAYTPCIYPYLTYRLSCPSSSYVHKVYAYRCSWRIQHTFRSSFEDKKPKLPIKCLTSTSQKYLGSGHSVYRQISDLEIAVDSNSTPTGNSRPPDSRGTARREDSAFKVRRNGTPFKIPVLLISALLQPVTSGIGALPVIEIIVGHSGTNLAKYSWCKTLRQWINVIIIATRHFKIGKIDVRCFGRIDLGAGRFLG